MIGAFFLGALCWTFLEYVFHRWLGHQFRGNFFCDEHTRHHSQGDYFAPTWKKVAAALLTSAVVSVPAMTLCGTEPGAAFTAGLLSLYIGYEWLHRRQHTHAGIGAYGRWARRHHFHHHFCDPRTNHGVTSPLWDLVFGTYAPVSSIAVPERLTMRWLTDDAGDVLPALARTYSIRRRRGRVSERVPR